MPDRAPLLTTLPRIHEGKVRDTYQLSSPNVLLHVATDNISTHDVPHLSTIPKKGEVLTAMTVANTRWLNELGIKHHVVASGRQIYRCGLCTEQELPPSLLCRSLVVRKLDMVPAELIYRKYLTGSLWRKYYSKNKPEPYGLNLPPGLPLMYRFPATIFTPTEKTATDDPIPLSKFPSVHPQAEEARDLGLAVFTALSDLLGEKYIEVLDSKFEIGIDPLDGALVVGDEIVTPDSSRFALKEDMVEGQDPDWLDKQLARDYAEKTWPEGDKYPLEFPADIVRELTDTYLGVFERIYEKSLEDFQEDDL